MKQHSTKDEEQSQNDGQENAAATPQMATPMLKRPKTGVFITLLYCFRRAPCMFQYGLAHQQTGHIQTARQAALGIDADVPP
jgi:hypothetical protein